MHYKKILLFCISIISLFSGVTFSGFQARLYCEVVGNQIIVSTKQEEWLNKCSAYVDNLNILLQQKYDEILLILQYQKQTQDKSYRKEIYELKKQEFSKLMKYKTSVMSSLQTFEDNFFQQYQNLISHSLNTYLIYLEGELASGHYSGTQQNADDEKIFQQLHQQIRNIKTILAAEKLDDIILQIPGYLYLKNQLEKWK